MGDKKRKLLSFLHPLLKALREEKKITEIYANGSVYSLAI